MKKVVTLMLAIGLFSFSTQSFAQDTTKVKKTRVRKVKAAVATTATTATTTAKAAVPVAPTPAPAVAKTVTTTKAKVATTASTVKSSDKVFGTDAKGRTIYEGKEGGHYYMNASGKKEYVKKTE